MIYVRLELWPKGDARERSVIGEGWIENETGDGPCADYRCHFIERTRDKGTREYRSKVYNFWRLGSGSLTLLFKALYSALGSDAR